MKIIYHENSCSRRFLDLWRFLFVNIVAREVAYSWWCLLELSALGDILVYFFHKVSDLKLNNPYRLIELSSSLPNPPSRESIQPDKSGPFFLGHQLIRIRAAEPLCIYSNKHSSESPSWGSPPPFSSFHFIHEIRKRFIIKGCLSTAFANSWLQFCLFICLRSSGVPDVVLPTSFLRGERLSFCLWTGLSLELLKHGLQWRNSSRKCSQVTANNRSVSSEFHFKNIIYFKFRSISRSSCSWHNSTLWHSKAFNNPSGINSGNFIKLQLKFTYTWDM